MAGLAVVILAGYGGCSNSFESSSAVVLEDVSRHQHVDLVLRSKAWRRRACALLRGRERPVDRKQLVADLDVAIFIGWSGSSYSFDSNSAVGWSQCVEGGSTMVACFQLPYSGIRIVLSFGRRPAGKL